MSHEIALRGVVPVVPTPFRDDESIDLDGIASCVEFAVRCGVCAVCLPAYGSEFYKLTEAERRQVVETAIKTAALDLFKHILPQLVFSLQSMELFLCLEKRLLAARGVLPQTSTHVRRPTWTPDADALTYGLRLNQRVIVAAELQARRES